MNFVISAENYSENNQENLLGICKRNFIDLVLLQCGSFMVPMYNYLNSGLNNKGNAHKTSMCSIDKSFMRNVLNKHHISAFRFKKISCDSDLSEVNFYPCILKPSIGTGSDGVFLANSADMLRFAWNMSKKEATNTEFTSFCIAEEFIEGRQFDVEGIVHQGQVKVLCIVEENYIGFFPRFDMNWYLFNAIINSELEQKIHSTVSKAFEAFELMHGAFHCELKIDSKGQVRILDFANRTGGGFELPISEATGNNFVDIYIRSMLDKELSIKDTIGLRILDKYFKDLDEFNQWSAFLKERGVNFTCNKIYRRENIRKISVKTKDDEVIYSISEKFNLGIQRV